LCKGLSGIIFADFYALVIAQINGDIIPNPEMFFK